MTKILSSEEWIKSHFKEIEKLTWYPPMAALADGYAKYRAIKEFEDFLDITGEEYHLRDLTVNDIMEALKIKIKHLKSEDDEIVSNCCGAKMHSPDDESYTCMDCKEPCQPVNLSEDES